MISLIAKAKAEGHSDKEAHLIAFHMKHGKSLDAYITTISLRYFLVSPPCYALFDYSIIDV